MTPNAKKSTRRVIEVPERGTHMVATKDGAWYVREETPEELASSLFAQGQGALLREIERLRRLVASLGGNPMPNSVQQSTPLVRAQSASVEVGDKVALGATMFGLPARTALTVAKIYDGEPPVPRDIVSRLRETLTSETLTSEDADEAMWQRIRAERREAASTIEMLRIKLHRERSKRGHAIAAREAIRHAE